ncbi:hypothetical protein [Eggerthella sinensis]|nr:hypothetical protein [Eggerthella sinensis]
MHDEENQAAQKGRGLEPERTDGTARIVSVDVGPATKKARTGA